MLILRNHPLKVFLQYLLADIAAISERSSKSDKDSKGHEAVVSDSEVREPEEVSEAAGWTCGRD